MQAVNLLPVELRPGRRWATIGRGASVRRVLGGSGVAAGILALAIGGLSLHQRSVVDDRQSDLVGAEARLVAAQAKAAAVRQAQATSAARLAAMRDIVARRILWEDVLRDLSRILPQNVWLQSLNASSSTIGQAPAAGSPPAAGAASTGFTVTGSADSQVRVAQVLDRLSLLPWLSDVTLQSSSRGGGQTATPVQFTIGATLRSTGGR